MGRLPLDPNEETVRFTVRLPEPLLRFLQMTARRDGRTVSEALRDILYKAVERA